MAGAFPAPGSSWPEDAGPRTPGWTGPDPAVKTPARRRRHEHVAPVSVTALRHQDRGVAGHLGMTPDCKSGACGHAWFESKATHHMTGT